MDMENARIVGLGMMSLFSILGGYYLILKIREFHSEKPDPKITYVTHSQMERTRMEIMRSLGDAVQDLRTLRAEIREETRGMQKRYERSISEMRELISRNSQNISSLIAQAQIANQRIAELTLKTDKLSFKINKGE